MKTCKYLIGFLVIAMTTLSTSCLHMRNPYNQYTEDSSMYAHYDSIRMADSSKKATSKFDSLPDTVIVTGPDGKGVIYPKTDPPPPPLLLKHQRRK